MCTCLLRVDNSLQNEDTDRGLYTLAVELEFIHHSLCISKDRFPLIVLVFQSTLDLIFSESPPNLD